MKRFFTIFLSVLFVMVTPFLLIELCLFTLDKITHKNIFSPLISGPPPLVNKELIYPKNPDDFFKIAIYGGSAANGYNSARKPHQFLKYNLSKLYPNKKFFIKSYAEEGRPFHRYGAELAKQSLHKYDAIIIYAGTNEHINYVNDSSYFIKPEYQGLNLSKKPSAMEKELEGIPPTGVIPTLSRYSRIFSLAKKITSKVKPADPSNIFRIIKFTDNESSLVVPWEERAKLIQNYKEDLESIQKIASDHGVHIFLVTEVPDFTAEPMCSAHTPGMNEASINVFQSKYLELTKFNLVQLTESRYIPPLESLVTSNPNHARSQYLLARALLANNFNERAYQHFRLAIDYDCQPLRALTGIHKVSELIAHNAGNITFVDAISHFIQAQNIGIKSDELFVDTVHPNFSGHTLLSRIISCAITNSRLIDAPPAFNICNPLSSRESLLNESNTVRSVLNVLPQEDKIVAQYSSRMNISLAFRAAHSWQYLKRAAQQLEEYRNVSKLEPYEEAQYHVYKFMIHGLSGNRSSAIDSLNKALNIEPAYTQGLVFSSALATGEAVTEVLDLLKIQFDSSTKLFK